MTRAALAAALLLTQVACSTPADTMTLRPRFEEGRVVVEGATSLPDEAPVHLYFEKPSLDRPYSSASATVREGRFAATLPVPPTLPEGAYAVRAVFAPEDATGSLRERLAAAAARLRGPQVRRTAGGGKTLEGMEPLWIGPAGV